MKETRSAILLFRSQVEDIPSMNYLFERSYGGSNGISLSMVAVFWLNLGRT